MTGVEDAIGRLKKQGRSIELDVLPASASREVIAPVLAAMANSRQGGTLVIGAGAVPPDDKPIQFAGIQDALETLDRVLQSALSLQPPLIIPLPQVIEHDGKKLVVTHVPPGMPHVYACEGRYLRRDHADGKPCNAALSHRDLRHLLIERGEITFEAEPARDVTLADLDWDKAKAYAMRMGAADVEQLLLKRGCLARSGNDAGQLRPTHAGILLFGRDVQSIVKGADITAVRFASEKMTDTFTRQDITGTLPDQIRRAETFLRDHLRVGVELQGAMERREQFEYPLEAARELVVNAVAHRDYSISGDGIRLYLFKDHMEITSPGLLPGPVTVDNIRDERFSRNPAIVQVLADMGFIERLGYGVDRVIELMRQNSLREPEFRETSGGFRVVLYNKDALPPVRSTTRQPIIEQAIPTFRGMMLNPRQETAIQFLTEGRNLRITNSELQRLHPDVHPETIRRDLSDLVTKNILAKMGEKRGSYYVLRAEENAEVGLSGG